MNKWRGVTLALAAVTILLVFMIWAGSALPGG
jgi:hypothetical protein